MNPRERNREEEIKRYENRPKNKRIFDHNCKHSESDHACQPTQAAAASTREEEVVRDRREAGEDEHLGRRSTPCDKGQVDSSSCRFRLSTTVKMLTQLGQQLAYVAYPWHLRIVDRNAPATGRVHGSWRWHVYD